MYGIAALNNNRKESPVVRQLAAKGRGGDDTVAHLTSGEVIIPKSAQSPGLMALYAKEMRSRGMKPSTYQVGSPDAQKRRNPFTGAQQFYDARGGDDQGMNDRGGYDGNTGSGPDGVSGRENEGSWGGGFDVEGNPQAGGGGVGGSGDPATRENAGFGFGEIDGADIRDYYGQFADINTPRGKEAFNAVGSIIPGMDIEISNDPKTGMMREALDFDLGQAVGEVLGGIFGGPIGGAIGGWIGDTVTDDPDKDIEGGTISRDKSRSTFSGVSDVFSGMFDSSKRGPAFDPGSAPAYEGSGSSDGGGALRPMSTASMFPVVGAPSAEGAEITPPTPGFRDSLPFIDYERYGQSNRRDRRVGEELMYPYIINGQTYFGQYPYEFLETEENA